MVVLVEVPELTEICSWVAINCNCSITLSAFSGRRLGDAAAALEATAA